MAPEGGFWMSATIERYETKSTGPRLRRRSGYRKITFESAVSIVARNGDIECIFRYAIAA